MKARLAAGLPAACIVAALAAFAATAFGEPATAGVGARGSVDPGPWCGGVLWRQMAFSDPARGRVDIRPIPTTIAQIGALAPPATIALARSTSFQRHIWSLRAVIDRYRIASNGEIVLILYSIDSGKYMDAYLPNPNCLSRKSRLRGDMLAARGELKSRCPQVLPAWQLIGITVEIEGVGFWNSVQTTRGALPNGAELRPVTDLVIVTGCGIG